MMLSTTLARILLVNQKTYQSAFAISFRETCLISFAVPSQENRQEEDGEREEGELSIR